MSANWAVVIDGLDDLARFDRLKPEIRIAAARAINKITRNGRVEIARAILGELNFPASYVAPGQKRLYVSQQATESNLEGKITARGRATSLARFVSGSTRAGEGVRIEVKRGRSELLERAFLVRLNAGSDTDTQSNLGLAIRLKPGQSVRNKRASRPSRSGLAILYGPSVSQAFRREDGRGIASDKAPKLSRELSREFLRLLDL